ncbi:MAG: chemotaxis protein CheX [Fibrobacteres bacterium]|nr:chemotaxis protein CheX [Fibrobacterota bacterium]
MNETLLASTLNTFQTMLMIELTPVTSEPYPPIDCEFAGMIGFSGDISGNIAICMSRATAMEAALAFVGEQVTEDSELSDCVGELVNMIAGNAKSSMHDMNVSLSIPEVIIGKDIRIDFCRFKTKTDLYFDSSAGPIHLIFTQR